MSYELHVGPIPAGMSVLHRCDNPPRVRPDHLFLGTNTDNISDKVAKGRQPRRDCTPYERRARGERCGPAKLTDAAVQHMRARFADGETQAALAEAFSVSKSLVHVVVRRHAWKHVT